MDELTLICESQYSNTIRQDVIFKVFSLLTEDTSDRFSYYVNNILTEKEIVYLVKEGWGAKLTASLALILGIVIGQISPTSNPALSARNEIMKIIEGGLSVNQSWGLITKTFSDKYAVTNLDWLKPYLKNFNMNDANHQKLIKLIGNAISQDNTLIKPVNQMSDQERSVAIVNSNKLQKIVLAELGIQQSETTMSLNDLAQSLSDIQQQSGLK